MRIIIQFVYQYEGGDFVKNNSIKSLTNVCSKKYFYDGIKYMQKKLEQPVFIIFSDDVIWCKRNLELPDNTYFEDGTDPIWEKLRLMYSCKNFIISNSTFSWWAQYLSRNDNKIVVAPSRWRNFEMPNDIYEDNWIKINVD